VLTAVLPAAALLAGNADGVDAAFSLPQHPGASDRLRAVGELEVDPTECDKIPASVAPARR
jgi:hypothetical protein